MKKKKIKKISVLWWLVVVLIFCVSLTVSAAQKHGSISVKLPEEAKNTEMLLYKVAFLENGNFVYTEDFADCGIVISDMNHSGAADDAAKKLSQYVQEQGLAGKKAHANAEWVVFFGELEQGLYLIVPASQGDDISIQPSLVSVPFADKNQGQVFDVTVTPKYSFSGGAVIVLKTDEEGKALKEARFVLQEKTYLQSGESVPEGAESGTDENGTFYWKEFKTIFASDENGQIAVTGIPAGDYRLVEVQAPEGFVMTKEPAYFTISGAGQVVKNEGVYEAGSGRVESVTVVNAQTQVEINKTDKDGKPVSGAKLVIKDKDGKVIQDQDGNPKYAFVSGAEPYVIKRLPAGTYFLSETEAPKGYKKAADVAFDVSGTDAGVIKVIMVDEKDDTPEVTPTPGPGNTPGNNNKHNSPGTPSSPHSPVKTGDDTPIGLFVVAIILAAGAIGGIVIYKKKK